MGKGCGCIRIYVAPRATWYVSRFGKHVAQASFAAGCGCQAAQCARTVCMMKTFNVFLKEGRFQDAENAALAALGVDPSCAVAQVALAVAHHEIEKKVLVRKSARERAIEEALQRPVNLQFDNTPLCKVLDDLRAFQGVNIHVDAVALEEAGISLDRQVSIKVEQVSFKSALNLLLHDMHLTWVIKDEVLVITTEKVARGKLQTHVFAVADLLNDERDPESVMKLITGTIDPRTWAEVGGPGTIDFYPLGKAIVVNQTADVQEQVADLLQALRRLDEAEARKRVVQSVSVEAAGLVKACRLALEDGRFEKAKQLAREAHALCPWSVLHDPTVRVVYLMSIWQPARFGGEENCEEPPTVCPGEPMFGPEERFQPVLPRSVWSRSWWQHMRRFSGEESCEPPSDPMWFFHWMPPCWSDNGGDCRLNLKLPPVDYQIPAAFDGLLMKGMETKPVLLLLVDEEEPVPPGPKVDPESEFELELPDFTLSIPEIDTSDLDLPEDLVSWSLGLSGVTCAELSNCFGQWRISAQFKLGDSVFRVRFDEGAFELSVLPTAPVVCPE
jgi:hypothetical protein